LQGPVDIFNVHDVIFEDGPPIGRWIITHRHFVYLTVFEFETQNVLVFQVGELALFGEDGGWQRAFLDILKNLDVIDPAGLVILIPEVNRITFEGVDEHVLLHFDGRFLSGDIDQQVLKLVVALGQDIVVVQDQGAG